MEQRPLVTVGMPTFNRPDGLKRALASIRAQTYGHLEIIISDNASTDPSVALLIADASREDDRIRAYRQESNRGPYFNFIFVLRQAKGPFFMWAADDDEWHPEFVEKLLAPLLLNPKTGLSFCDFEVRYPNQTPCQGYGSFYHAYREFLHADGVCRVFRYATQAPERGKANLIYGLFRVEALREGLQSNYFDSRAWGADMLFVCDILSRWSFNLLSEKLYVVGIPFECHQLQVQQDPRIALHPGRMKRQMIESHLRYFFSYLRIMSLTPGASPRSTIRLLVQLFPTAVRWLKQDLA